MSHVTSEDVRVRVSAVIRDLADACSGYHYRKIGAHALYDAACKASLDLGSLLAGWPEDPGVAGLYTSQGRILADIESLKGRLTAQDDRITGIATDLQGLVIDIEEGRGDGR